MSRAPVDEARAWLVFRLGPHVMCASALDVVGIIEPVRPRPVPFSPAYMLGWFDFRGGVAAVISLRRKLGVRTGEDSNMGPYVVARVQGDLAAFWVDEVRDVLESHQADWQPMPEIPGTAAFDCYTIRDGEVILRTAFERLLQADTVASFSTGAAAAAAEPAPAAPAPVASAGAPPPLGPVEDGPPQAPREATPPEPEPAEVAPPEPEPAEPDPLPAQPEARTAETPRRPAKVEPPPRTTDVDRDSAQRPRSSFRETARPAGTPAPSGATRAPRPSSAAPQREVRASRAPVEAPVAAASAYFAAPPPPPSPPPAAETYDVVEDLEPAHAWGKPRRRRVGLRLATGLLLAMAIVWLGWRTLPPEAPVPVPVAASESISPPVSVPAPSPVAQPAVIAPAVERVVAAPPPPPAAQPVAAPSPPPAASAAEPKPEPAARRILTIEGERFTLTVDRPAKPQPPAAAPQAARTPAHPEDGVVRMRHVVVRGDTLGHIAHQYLGDAARYPELARLSRIRNPHLIYPGDLVTIHKGYKASSRP